MYLSRFILWVYFCSTQNTKESYTHNLFYFTYLPPSFDPVNGNSYYAQQMNRFQRFGLLSIMVFCSGFILCFPTNCQILPDVPNVLGGLLSPVIAFFGHAVFGFEDFSTEILSDSKAMYALTAFLLFFSTLVALILSILKPEIPLHKIQYWFVVLIRYYLAYQLLNYGFNKVFKWQFFMPEPNTVYTPIGQVTPGLLYWSTVGSSYAFTVFAGVLEVLCAVLLLFRKTFRAGALLGLVIMANVVAINFGFNISVKLFSTFLMALSLLILWPDLSRFKAILFESSEGPSKRWRPIFDKNRTLYRMTKISILLLLVFDALFIYAKTGNWNDDTTDRTPLHGAYDVLDNTSDWKQVFFHRKGYFIVKDAEDHFIDFDIQFDTSQKRFLIERGSLTYTFAYEMDANDLLILHDLMTGRKIKNRKLPYRNLPLFKDNFDWWID